MSVQQPVVANPVSAAVVQEGGFRRLWRATALTCLGIAVVVGATFLPWTEERFFGHERHSGWDLVDLRYVPAQFPHSGVGPHWLHKVDLCDCATQWWIFTGLPVIAAACVVAVGVFGILWGTCRRCSRWISRSAVIMLVGGVSLVLFSLVNLGVFSSSDFLNVEYGSWVVFVGALMVLGGGVLAWRSNPMVREQER